MTGQKQRVAILGYARQGISSFKHWQAQGAEVTICDQDEDKDIPDSAKAKLGQDYLANLDEFDVLVRTPRLHPQAIVDANPEAPDILSKVTSATNEFFKLIDTPILGVTGTKGKGTTTLLAAEMLKAAGYKVLVAGNIGTSPLDVLEEARAADYVVLELSNFQTMDMQHSPDVAVCLRITPEHLDWHTDYDEYVAAKAQMFKHQTSAQLAVYSIDSDKTVQAVTGVPSKLRTFSMKSDANLQVIDDHIRLDGQTIASVPDVKLLGRHNLENVMAAIGATWDIIGDTKPIVEALHACTGFEHRLEPVRTVNGITYINDSFASAPESTIAAVKALRAPMVLIVGGASKNSDYSTLAQTIASEPNVKHIITIGQTGDEIHAAIQEHRDVPASPGGKTMEEIITTATQHAEDGDSVVLSTASASFDMFNDFEDRGNQFKQVVNSL